MRRIGLMVALVALGACTKKDPLFCDGSHACADPARPFCDVNGEFAASDGIKNTCIAAPYDAMPPDAASGCDGMAEGTTTCSGSTLMTCNGGSWVSSDCPLGCYTDGTRCWDVDPSNGLGQYLDKAVNGPDLVLTDGAQIVTTDGSVKNGDQTVLAVPHDLVAQSGAGPDIMVFEVHSLVLNDVRIWGDAAVAFVVDGDVTLQGYVAAGALFEAPGPGGFDSTGTAGMACAGHPGDFSTSTWSGSGGGGFGASGGRGGANGSIAGGDGGLPDGTENGVPLRGGCAGAIGSQDFPGGGGGGAIQIVSRTAIRIDSNAAGVGIIDVGGGAPMNSSKASGGGSGGLILLEAPTVMISGSGAGAVSNGGGGGTGSPDGTLSIFAENGGLATTPAPGAQCPGECGAGGNGGAGTTPAGSGTDYTGSASPSGAGAGGGSVGRIRFNTVSATITQGAGTVVSGSTTYGTLSKR